jgi:glycogen operon protein
MIHKKPYNSINYYVSHDDCNSLLNIFSYNSFFHLNEASIKWDQLSWDHNRDVEMQKKAVRNAFTLLMMSAGVPMFAGGDEFLRSIPEYDENTGLMNLVTLDKDSIYIDWERYNKLQQLLRSGDPSADSYISDSDGLYTFEFLKRIINFRKCHPCLRPDEYYRGTVNSLTGLKDITWYSKDGYEIDGQEWDGQDFIAYRVDSGGERVSNPEDKAVSIYVAYNRSPVDMDIRLPENVQGKRWYRIADTDNSNGWMTGLRNFDGGKTELYNHYRIHDRSVLVLTEK